MKKVYEFLNKLATPLEKVIFAFAGAGMALIAVIIFIQVVFRVLGRSLSWSEEISRYIEVWIVFLTAGYALGKGQHICMDLLIHVLPKKVNFILEKVNAVICIIFAGICTYYSYLYMMSERMQMFASMNISKVWVYISMVIGFVLCIFYSVMNLTRPEGWIRNVTGAVWLFCHFDFDRMPDRGHFGRLLGRGAVDGRLL